MARQGEKPITNTAIQAQLAKLKSQIDSILSFLVFIGGTEKKNFMLQGDYETILNAGSAVTFPHPYKALSKVIVVGISNTEGYTFSALATPTGFTAKSSPNNSACYWFALGER